MMKTATPTIFLTVILMCAAMVFAQSDRMSSANYQLDRGAFIAAGETAEGSVHLTDQFGTTHLNRMSSSRFKIGTHVEFLAADQEALPADYAFGPNYPNPFNQSTIFRFSLPRLCGVEVTVYSMLGRCVATLVREQKPAGIYEFKYNGDDDRGMPLPSGVYFCRLSTKEFDKTIKFAILK
jgi:hypothetical protein